MLTKNIVYPKTSKWYHKIANRCEGPCRRDQSGDVRDPSRENTECGFVRLARNRDGFERVSPFQHSVSTEESPPGIDRSLYQFEQLDLDILSIELESSNTVDFGGVWHA